MYTITVLGQDYTAADPLQVTFLSGVAMLNDIACASISIVDDNSLEGLHSFSVHIIGVEVESGLPAQLFVGSPTYATVYICDNEGTLNNCQTLLKNDSYSHFFVLQMLLLHSTPLSILYLRVLVQLMCVWS